MASQPLFDLQSFQTVPTGITHVCAAGESLPLRANNDAMSRYMADKAGGHSGRRSQTSQIDMTRNMIASVWSVFWEEIGFVSNVAEGVSMVLESLHWVEEDNVCVDVDEYPSLVAPFAYKSQRNCDSQMPSFAPASPHMRYCNGVADIAAKADKRTRLILVSHVSYLNGARSDPSFLRSLADSIGAMLLVDFTQAAGYLAIDASIADFAFSACYKWLLGTTGAAIAYWNRTRQPNWKPGTAGWHSLSLADGRPQWGSGELDVRDDAMCFSRGNPAHLSIYILSEGLKYLRQWDVREIEMHIQSLTSLLLRKFSCAGIPSTTPQEVERRGASVTVDCLGASTIVDELYQAGIYAWNGRGRVRFSFHGYNSRKDVERIMEVFPALWKRQYRK